MPRYYCDYCDTYLTHDSAPGRKQHNRGWKHRDNVRDHYAEYTQDFYDKQRGKRDGPPGGGQQNFGFNLPPRGMGGPPRPLFSPMMGGPPPNFGPGPGGPPPPHMMGMPPGMPPPGRGPPPPFLPPHGEPPRGPPPQP